MPHMQWIDPSWNYEPCSSEEAESRQREMQGILDGINKLIGYDPNSPSAKAERLVQENYSKAITKAKIDYTHTMDLVLHEYHRARALKNADVPAIEKIYDNSERQAARDYSKAEERANGKYERASNRATRDDDA